MLFTIVTLAIVAKYFGSSFERDNWLLAYSTFIFVDLAIWGPINEVFRTKYVEVKTVSGHHTALDSLSSLFKFVGLGTILISFLFYMGAYEISRFLLPDASMDQIEQLAFMLKVISPSLLINQFTLLFSSVLNAHDVFFVPEIAGLVSAVFNVVFIIAFYQSLGIYTLFVGHYFSLLVLLVMLMLFFYRNRIPILKMGHHFRFSEIKPYLLFALPFFFPYFATQVAILTEKYFAGQIGEGTVSNLDYSRKFVEMPVTVLSAVIMTLFVPTVSALFFGKRKAEIDGELNKFLSFGSLVLMLFISFVVFFSEELIFLLLDRGAMSFNDLMTINDVLLIYIAGSYGVFLYVLFGMSMLSTSDAKRYAVVGSVAQLLIIVTNYLGYTVIGIYIFPLSYIGIHTLAAIMMFVLLRKRQILMHWYPAVKFLFALVLTTGIFFLSKQFFTFDHYDKLGNIMAKCICYVSVAVPLILVTNLKRIKLLLKSRSLS